MKQAQAGEHERAAANATLLAVMRRMASPLRHDLAGALLIPSLRLQMLRRQLGAATLARERLQAMVDEVIAALDAVRKTQVEACGWLEQSDDTPVALDGALAAAMATFNLFFSARGIGLELRDSGAPQSLSYPAQALRLLLHAGFFLALDHAPGASTLVVECTADAGGARLSWHFEADKAAEGGPCGRSACGYRDRTRSPHAVRGGGAVPHIRRALRIRLRSRDSAGHAGAARCARHSGLVGIVRRRFRRGLMGWKEVCA